MADRERLEQVAEEFMRSAGGGLPIETTVREVGMDYRAIRFVEKFERFSDHWAPKIVARMNDYHFKLVKIQGEFVWHRHEATDEVFVVLDGSMTIHFRDGDVRLEAGEMFVVPRGVEHKPSAERECKIMLVEPDGTVNTGELVNERTAADAWI